MPNRSFNGESDFPYSQFAGGHALTAAGKRLKRFPKPIDSWQYAAEDMFLNSRKAPVTDRRFLSLRYIL